MSDKDSGCSLLAVLEMLFFLLAAVAFPYPGFVEVKHILLDNYSVLLVFVVDFTE